MAIIFRFRLTAMNISHIVYLGTCVFGSAYATEMTDQEREVVAAEGAKLTTAAVGLSALAGYLYFGTASVPNEKFAHGSGVVSDEVNSDISKTIGKRVVLSTGVFGSMGFVELAGIVVLGVGCSTYPKNAPAIGVGVAAITVPVAFVVGAIFFRNKMRKHMNKRINRILDANLARILPSNEVVMPASNYADVTNIIQKMQVTIPQYERALENVKQEIFAAVNDLSVRKDLGAYLGVGSSNSVVLRDRLPQVFREFCSREVTRDSLIALYMNITDEGCKNVSDQLAGTAFKKAIFSMIEYYTRTSDELEYMKKSYEANVRELQSLQPAVRHRA